MNKELLPHEINHINELRKVAGECALFLKKDNSFPLKEVTNITLIGNGVRHAVIGGTGSGAVNTRYKPTIEEAFINAGFKIDSNSWLDQYDEIREKCEKDFVKEIKKEAKKHKTMAPSYALGKEILEPEYNFAINGDKKVAIYILSRNGGENSDRRLEKGDVYLSDTEVRDIHYLNDNYEKFLLVLNTPNIIDLERIKDVKNILLLSQLGSVTSDVLVDIVIGKINPSGKLTDTYAYIKDYPYISTPISEDETNYLEGSYVGYRYFSSKDIKPIFPFGFGLSYTEFISQLLEYKVEGDNVSLKVKVTNVGPLSGKEVIQVYISAPSPRPKLELVAFKKSGEIKEKESEILELNFSLRDFPLYSVEEQAYMLNKGNYHVYFGNSSDSLKEVVVLSLIYIERLIYNTGLLLTSRNWRRILLTSMIIASKIWDDNSFENSHFSQVFANLGVNEINTLERIFLELINYKVYVKQSEYFKYLMLIKEIALKYSYNGREIIKASIVKNLKYQEFNDAMQNRMRKKVTLNNSAQF